MTHTAPTLTFTGNLPDYGYAHKMWRAEAGPAWTDYTEHAFVQGLADGTLPRRAYLHYMVQDYRYLVHYSRAWALGVFKAETQAEMQFCAAAAHSLIAEEMHLHIATCAAEGLSEADLFAAEEEPANLAYTRYVLEAGLSGDFLDLMAALAPCAFGYGEIGLALSSHKATSPYRDWIETYAGPEYQTMCQDFGKMLDQAIFDRVGPEPENNPIWPRLSKHFRNASRLETGFWQMGLSGMATP